MCKRAGYFLLLITVGYGVVFAADFLPLPETGTTSEMMILQEKGQKLLQEEARLSDLIREETRTAERPYAEYLLYQKSIRLSEHETRLQELKNEKLLINQRLLELNHGNWFSSDFRSTEWPSAVTYSGAPPLANDAKLSHTHGLGPFWTVIYRFIFVATLVLIITLPLTALWKIRFDLSHTGIRCVYPLLTVRKIDGHRAFLQIPVRRKG